MTTHAVNGTTSNQTTTRLPGLDGLRALAVIAVIAFHEQLSAFPGGFLGVDVFFVLSGYLITDLLVAQWNRHGHLALRGFWARRARRLLPALGVLLVAVTAATAVIEPAQMTALRDALLAAVTYSSNWWQALAHHSYFAQFGPPPPLQHLWSLAIEEQFYLLWPLLLIVILKTCQSGRLRAALAWLGAALSALAMVLVYVPGADPSRVYYGTDTHAVGPVHRLSAGADLATAPDAGAEPRRRPGPRRDRPGRDRRAGLGDGPLRRDRPGALPGRIAGRGPGGRRCGARRGEPGAGQLGVGRVGAALDRDQVLRDLPVALAGHRAGRCGVPAPAPGPLDLAARGGALRSASPRPPGGGWRNPSFATGSGSRSAAGPG